MRYIIILLLFISNIAFSQDSKIVLNCDSANIDTKKFGVKTTISIDYDLIYIING